MDFGDRTDNPFSVSLRTGTSRRRRAFKSSVRFFLLACLGSAVCLVVTTQGQRWLVSRLTTDFDSLSLVEKRQRLKQLAELEPTALPALADALADPELEVGRTAYELLQQVQNEWTVLLEQERFQRHATLVDALESVAVRLPEDRTGWGTSLLQQTLMVAVDRNDENAQQLYRQANHALELFSLTGRSGAATAHSRQLDWDANQDGEASRQPTRLSIRAQPLPVDQSSAADLWTQWPPPNEMRYASERIAKEGSANQQASLTTEQPIASSGTATVYRSGGKLQPVHDHQAVDLSEVPKPSPAGVSAVKVDQRHDATLSEAASLVSEPMGAYDDASVMRWLASDHQRLQQAATDELIRRGYQKEELDLASQIVTGDVATRLALVDYIARYSKHDPRRWLPLLLSDPSRDVKLLAISVLATMDDPSVSQRLHMHLAHEQDPTVAARIRRVLKLR